MLSTENDIRKAVVNKLLSEGLSKDQIRIELPLDTGSCGGRADIVVLSNALGCIELKSGKDKYTKEALEQQCNQYKRAFDGCITCVDLVHYREKDVGVRGSVTGAYYKTDNWSAVDVQYSHKRRRLEHPNTACSREEFVNQEFSNSLIDLVFRWQNPTCIYDVCLLLWASEIKELFGTKQTKSGFVDDMRENGKLSELRPLVIKALRNRPLNKWEDAFWKEQPHGGDDNHD